MPVPIPESGLSVLTGALGGFREALKEEEEVDFAQHQLDENRRQFNKRMDLAFNELRENARQFDLTQEQQAELSALENRLRLQLQGASLGAELGIRERGRISEEKIEAERQKTERYRIRTQLAGLRAEYGEKQNQALEGRNLIDYMDTLDFKNTPRYALKDATTGAIIVLPGANTPEIAQTLAAGYSTQFGIASYQVVPNPEFDRKIENLAKYHNLNVDDPLLVSPEDRANSLNWARNIIANEDGLRQNHKNTLREVLITERMSQELGGAYAAKEIQQIRREQLEEFTRIGPIVFDPEVHYYSDEGIPTPFVAKIPTTNSINNIKSQYPTEALHIDNIFSYVADAQKPENESIKKYLYDMADTEIDVMQVVDAHKEQFRSMLNDIKLIENLKSKGVYIDVSALPEKQRKLFETQTQQILAGQLKGGAVETEGMQRSRQLGGGPR